MAEPKQNSDDYISLDSLKDAIFGICKVIVWVFDGIGGLVRRYWMLFAVLVFMGTGVGLLLKKVITYNKDLSMLVKFNDLGRPFYAEIIESLNDLATSGSSERLAAELHLKEDDARQIAELTLDKVGKDEPSDDTSKKAPFLITVSLRSIAVADAVQSALLSYINDNPYLKKLKDSQAVFYRAQLLYLDGELRKLDSLKTAYNLSINSGKSSTIYYNAFNPAEIYFRSGQIMDKKLRAMEWLATEQDAMSLINSVKGEKIVRKHGVNQMVAGFAAGLVLAFLIALWQDIKTKIKRQEPLQPA
jgi:hypothetical protein